MAVTPIPSEAKNTKFFLRSPYVFKASELTLINIDTSRLYPLVSIEQLKQENRGE